MAEKKETKSAEKPAKKPAEKKASKKAQSKATAQPWHYDVLVRPIITEKSTMASAHNRVAFQVPTSASKPQVKEAVEAIYGVNVTAVNTMVQKGKTKRFRGIKGRRADVKKAYVTLKQGDSIDVMGNL